MDTTLHIGTAGYHVPSENAGSNLLSISSGYHLGPLLGTFTLQLATSTGQTNADDLFSGLNPLLVTINSSALIPAQGDCGLSTQPLDLRVRIGGVCFRVPQATALRLRAKNGGRIRWQTTTGASGFFSLFRTAPAVFR
jgi:hypothetical protein